MTDSHERLQRIASVTLGRCQVMSDYAGGILPKNIELVAKLKASIDDPSNQDKRQAADELVLSELACGNIQLGTTTY